jgi:cell division protein FtsQ
MQNRLGPRDLFEGGLRVFWLLAVLVLVLGLMDWLLRSGTYQTEELKIEGEFARVSESEIERMVMPLIKDNYLMLDLEKIQEQVESLPWVQRAWVRRSWPSGIHIRFAEQKPVAVWGDEGYVNAEGSVIADKNLTRESGLPRLFGPVGSATTVVEAYIKFKTVLQPMNSELVALTLTPRRSWQQRLSSNTEILVDQNGAEQKLERLAVAYKQFTKMPERFDLRYTNGFAVSWGRNQSPAVSSQK